MSSSSIHSRQYAILITIHNHGIPVYDIEEMKGMAKTAGYDIIHELEQTPARISTKYFIGTGKMEQIKLGLLDAFMDKKKKKEKINEELIQPNPFVNITPDESNNPFELDIPENEDEGVHEIIEVEEPEIKFHFPKELKTAHQITILFNNRIGNMQILNLQKEWNTTVIDRDHLILEIFELHARTRESKLQIELARMAMETSLIKKELGQHLSEHQGAGFMGKGMSGYAPMQRAYTNRKKKILDEIEQIRKERTLRRKKRSNFCNIGIIGYTNAGKTTFLNSIAKQALETANQEFTTVSTTSRKVIFPHYSPDGIFQADEFIFTDSVGFVYDISSILLDAFLSTLEELQFSDILFIIVDISDSPPRIQEKLSTSLKVISRIGGDDIPRVFIFNKVDRMTDSELTVLPIELSFLNNLIEKSPYFIISAQKKQGYRDLIEYIIQFKRNLPQFGK